MSLRHYAFVIAGALSISACTFVGSFTNNPLPANPPNPGPPMRATLAVTPDRGNGQVLVLLALSGGGSRAAYFSSAVMLKLQALFPERDLLAEVDAISSVSGGSLPAAYYAVSRDPRDEAGSVASNRVWDDETVKELMKRNYITRSVGNWFWPANIVQYWFTAFDRSDLMAQTFADNLFDVGGLRKDFGRDLTFADLNPRRPYLLINATNATGPGTLGDTDADRRRFGAVFTFTREDFRDTIGSNIADYSIARAVMASAAFPLVFPSMTLRDYRAYPDGNPCYGHDDEKTRCDRYLHVFDGGNSDNLGLTTVKRVLLQAALDGRLENVKRIVVISIDAFTRPVGTPRNMPDSRDGLFSYVLDANAVSAVDALLQANRTKVLAQFRERKFEWDKSECDSDLPSFPEALCGRLRKAKPSEHGFDGSRVLDLHDKLVFYHIGFEDVGKDVRFTEIDAETRERREVGLRDRLDAISTSLSLSDEDADALDEAVRRIVHKDNPCLRRIRDITIDPDGVGAQQAQAVCDCTERDTNSTAGCN